MKKIYVPANGVGDWKRLLAKPDKHWRTGYSAKSLAHCWQSADGFPEEVQKVLQKSGVKLFSEAELLIALPEHKVALPGGKRASQSDIFILAKGNNQLISIVVEGKVDEPFDKPIAEWKAVPGKGKDERLRYLCNLLKLDEKRIDDIYYQLIHRTASALIEAKRFTATNALMLVHSFSLKNTGFVEYCEFLRLYDATGEVNSLVFGKNIDGIDLYFGWVKGANATA